MLKCPLLNKDCIADKCMWFSKATMRDIKTQEVFVKGDCAIVMIPTMLIDIIKNSSGLQSAVESHRNHSVQNQNMLLSMLEGSREVRKMASPNEG